MFSLSRHGGHIRCSGSRIVPLCRPRQYPRRYSAIPPTNLKSSHSIYVSTSTDPYFNLTFEDWLFRFHPPNAPLLFLYRDAPCVVIGRSQNPWKEVNLAAAETKGIPWIRRRSGGGTVYHDLGNTNYSIHVPRTTFDRTVTANVIVRAVRALGVDAYVNERNDICVAGEKMSSAYKIANNRAYHHGTMLISTRLDTLGDLLRTKKVGLANFCLERTQRDETMHTKGIASVRSPVRNLVQSSASATHGRFVRAVIKSFREEYAIDEDPYFVHETARYVDDEYFEVGMSELQSWDWAYGQTPEFEYVIAKTLQWGQLTSTIRARHGIILSCSFSFPRDAHIPSGICSGLDRLSQRLIGKRYAFVDDSEVFGDDDNEGTEGMDDIWNWLKQEMCV